jgi:hypothetical protein
MSANISPQYFSFPFAILKCKGKQMREDKMGWACSMFGAEEKSLLVFCLRKVKVKKHP